MLNRHGLRLVGVDHEDLEPEPPAPIPFAHYARAIDRGVGPNIDAIQFALAALEGVSRKIEDLASELRLGPNGTDDTDRPRAA